MPQLEVECVVFACEDIDYSALQLGCQKQADKV